jgi:IS1 family transposase
MRNLPSTTLQLDEVHSFVGCREKSKAKAKGEHPGETWVWTALCADTKIIPSWHVGDRSGRAAYAFCADLSKRFVNRLQITSDGFPGYRWAVGANFRDVDFSQLIKVYATDEDGMAIVTQIIQKPVFGNPDMWLCSTSFIERSNLTLRMSNRRFTRSTNAFSKKLENHCAMLSVFFMHYNFVRRHTTLKTTPACAAGVADHEWTLEEVVAMMDDYFEAKLAQAFEAAFAERVTSNTRPKTYAPQKPKLPWYLDPDRD